MPKTRASSRPETGGPPLDLPRSLPALRRVAAECQRCDLWARATQTVFGEGAVGGLMLVGEQPGNDEDLAGAPFVGPAGRLLDTALAAAGIERASVYVTNAVKHFSWEPRGNWRIHKKPTAREVAACRVWLDAELSAVAPRVLVCLGATAAQALLGRSFRVSQQRGRPVESPLAPVVMATVHPASILRAPDDEARHRALAAFVADLRHAAEALRRATAARKGA